MASPQPTSHRQDPFRTALDQPQQLGLRSNGIQPFSTLQSPPKMCTTQKFTPEVMLAAPRRGAAVPNHDGTLVLYTVSTYDFVEGKQTKELKVMDIKAGISHVLSSDDSIIEALWLPGRSEVVCLVKGDNGATRLVVTNAAQSVGEGHVIAEFDGALTGMKLKRLDDDSIVFAAAGLVGDDGKLFNEEKEKKRGTARVFDTSRVWVVSSRPDTVVSSGREP